MHTSCASFLGQKQGQTHFHFSKFKSRVGREIEKGKKSADKENQMELTSTLKVHTYKEIAGGTINELGSKNEIYEADFSFFVVFYTSAD